MKINLHENIRITEAIAAKDIVDAIKNKTTLSILLGVGFMMLLGMALPWLLDLRNTPVAVIYDPGRSTLIRGLTARPEFRLYLVTSQKELEETVAGSPELLLGIVIPPGFQPAEGAGGELTLDGYISHRANPAKIAERVAFFETELSKASWQTIHINVAGHTVYPTSALEGQPFLMAVNITVLILVVGMILAPYLLIEEKETHTFEALLVSPARFSQVVTGKALAGGFYCLCAAVVIALFNAPWIVHWELAVLALGLGALFAVAVGLLLGAVCETPTTLSLWIGLLLLLLVTPTLLIRLPNAHLPEIVQLILPWVPSVAMSKLAGSAMVGSVPAGSVWPHVGILVVESLILYAVVGWRVRQTNGG